MPGANRAYRFLDPNTIALLALVFMDGRSGANLLAYPTATASTLRRYAVGIRYALAAVAHTCNLCY